MNLSSSLLTSLSTKKDKSSLPSPPMTASSSSFSTTSEPFSSSTTSLLTATTTTTSTSTTTATLPPPPPPPSVLPFSSSFNFIPVSDHLGAAALLSFCSTPSSNLDPSCQTFPSPLHGISNLTTTNRSSSSCSSSSSSSPHLSNLNRKNSSASSSSSSSMSLITPPTSISPFSSPPAWSPHSLIHASTFTHTTTTADTTHPSLERSLESSVPENAMSSLEIKGDQRRSSPLIKKEMDLDKNKETKMETKVPSSSFTPSSSSSSSLLYPTTTLSPLKTNSSSSSLPSNELTASLFTLPSKEEPSLIHLCPKEDSKTLEEEEKVKEDCSLSNSSSLLLAPLKEPAILENPVKKILDSFIHIKTCEYRSKQLGSIVDSGDFPCTCTYDHGRDKLDAACGEGSGCINRQLFIECQPDQCPCGDYCQNRRFQLHDYAPVEVFLTEHKGFGLRTLVDLKPNTFVIEYVGEVIPKAVFLHRAKLYHMEGNDHFYFMSLQKDEIIDAQRKGGQARFVNHSCNPNCVTQKWIVGNKLRIGLFTIRSIPAGTELTFDYKFERYGDEAQECKCGEPNCTGFIGSSSNRRTTEELDNLSFDESFDEETYLEEMTVSVTSKKKKPKLRPVTMDELTKVFQCLFWASKKSSWIVNRLILSSTEVLKEFLRKHGITILKLLLQELITLYTKCLETNPCNSSEANAKLAPVIQVLKLLDALPITVRNGIDRLEIDKWIEEKCMKLNDNEVNQLSQQLIEKWASLPSVYRIPKKTKVDPPSSTINSSPSYNATTSPKSSSVDEKSPENLPPSQLHPLYSKKNDDQKNNKNSTSAVSPSSSSSSSSSSSHHSSFNTSTHYSNNQYNSSSHSRRRQDSPQRYSSNQTQYYRHHHSQHQHHHPHHHHEPHHRSHLRVHQHSRQRSKSPLFVSEHSNVHRSRPASTNETFSFSSSPSNHNELHPNSSHRTFFSRQLYYQHVPHSRNNKTQRKRSRSPSPGETYHKRSSYFNAGSLNRYHPPAPAPPPAPPLSSSSSSDVFGSHVFHLKSSGSPSKLHPPFSSPPFQSSTKSPPYPRTSSPLHQIKYSVSQSPPPFGLSATSASRARSPVTPKKPTLTGQCNANLLNGYSSSKVYQQMEPPAEEVNLIFSPFQEKQSQREREVLIKELKEKAEQVLKKQPPKHSRPKTVAPVPYTPTTSIPTGSRPPPPLLAELIVKILSREQHVFGNRTEFKEVARKYAHAIFERDPQIVKNGKLSQRAQDKVKKFVQHSLTKMKWTKGIRRTSEKSLSSKDIKSSPKSTTTTPLQSSNSNDPLFIINNDDLLTTSNLASSSLSTALGLSSESSSSSTISFSQVFAPTSPIPLPTHVSQESSDSISTTTLFQSGASPVSPCGMSATTTTTSNSPQMPPFIHYSTSFSSKIVPSTIVEVSPIPSTESKNVVLSPFVSASDPAELRSATSTPPPSAFSSCPSAAFHPTQSPVLSHTSMVGPRLNVTLQDAAILSTPWKSPLSKKKIQNERMDYSRQGTSLPSFSPSSIKDMPSMTSSVSSNVHSSPFSTLPLSSLPVPLPPISKEQTLSSTSTQDQQWAMEIDPKIDQGPCPSLKSFEVHFMPISCGSPKLNGPPSPTPCTTFESWVESSSTSQVFTTRHTHS